MNFAVPYYRVSTDDKEQDPERQREIVEPWAAREGVTLLEPVVDEGTSASKTDPYSRPKFIVACEQAKAMSATAIVVECSDRFSRQGLKLDAWAEIELERRYGLRLFRADKPLDQHGTMAGDLTDGVHAEGARAWVRAHASKVKSGMANAKAKGASFGRPAKPLSPTEVALVLRLRLEGHGWGRCARAVSEARGAHRVVDPERRRKLEVSGSHVRRIVLALPKVPSVQKVSKAGVSAPFLQDTLLEARSRTSKRRRACGSFAGYAHEREPILDIAERHACSDSCRGIGRGASAREPTKLSPRR